MNEKEKLEREELISGYIDGQLTPRQMTEFKRMLAHDPQLQSDLEAMQLQQQLLQSLPVQFAPASLQQEIQSALERQYLLNASARQNEKGGKWGLYLRKMIAVAAMILLPLTVLGIVVYTILQPTESTSHVTTDTLAKMENAAPAKVSPAPQLLFSAVLQFQTGQPTAANDFVEKKIHSLGLMNFTATQRQSDRTSYKIVCSRKYVEGLVGELNELWSRSQNASYALLDANTRQPVQVEHIDALQTLAMIRLADVSAVSAMAHQINEQKVIADKVLAETPTDTKGIQPLMDKPSMPILAWPDVNSPAVTDDGPDTICLVIEILGL